ncbi:Hypothetical predicted protein [Scomber scombrus]|uniref:Uncharacterized protein n=1 Tax=Scomber scombrus TaxID=13677 RepID=A0AAV1PM94_SCOSC
MNTDSSVVRSTQLLFITAPLAGAQSELQHGQFYFPLFFFPFFLSFFLAGLVSIFFAVNFSGWLDFCTSLLSCESLPELLSSALPARPKPLHFSRSQHFEHTVENTKTKLINFSDCKKTVGGFTEARAIYINAEGVCVRNESCNLEEKSISRKRCT